MERNMSATMTAPKWAVGEVAILIRNPDGQPWDINTVEATREKIVQVETQDGNAQVGTHWFKPDGTPSSGAPDSWLVKDDILTVIAFLETDKMGIGTDEKKITEMTPDTQVNLLLSLFTEEEIAETAASPES
jgi:hypothetical protein